eukprot:6443506-Prymnesium_polylepis.1
MAIRSSFLACALALAVQRAAAVRTTAHVRMMAGAKTKAKKPAVSAAKKGFGAATVVANTKRKRWAEGPPEAELD